MSDCDIETFCNDENIKLGIITVPAESAQPICDRLTFCGVKAIWNFAPTILRVPENVVIENENLASSLAILCMRMRGEIPGAVAYSGTFGSGL